MAEKNPRGNGPEGTSGETFTDEVTVEIGDDRNHNFMWPPTKVELRGRWTRANLLPTEMVETVVRLPDIPGMTITISGRLRRLSIIDPLGDPKNAGIFAELAAHQKEHRQKTICAVDPIVFNNVSDSDIKTWLYWAYRLVLGSPKNAKKRGYNQGGPQATVINGTMPSLEKIMALNGRTRINHFDNTVKRRYLEDVPAEVS